METIVGIIMLVFCIGCAVLLIAMACSMWRSDEREHAVVITVLFLPILALLAVIPLQHFITERPVLTLYADEWKCSASHEETRTVMVGKIFMPQTYEVCDAYIRSN